MFIGLIKNKPAIIFLLAVFCLCFSLSGFAKFLQYLPANESMKTVGKEYSPSLKMDEIYCAAATELFAKAQDCDHCVNNLKEHCPDCCLHLDNCPAAAIDCTKEADVRYDCLPVAFVTDSCSVLRTCGVFIPDCRDIDDIAGCQERGCASTMPNGSCVPDGDDWICMNSQNLKPYYLGCAVTSGAKATGLIKKCEFQNYYIVTPEASPPFGGQGGGWGGGGWGQKYRYTPREEFKECVRDCLDYTREWEECGNRVYCCKENICDGEGFEESCDAVSCKERLELSYCDGCENNTEYNSQKCVDLWKEANNCLTDVAGGLCYVCFKELDEDLVYSFVPRSREKFVVTWQINATPVYQGDAPTYFYSMVKIIDQLTGEVVHNSIVHQKSFAVASNIFSATSVAGLTQGRTYEVRLYGFIPEDADRELSMEINRMQIIVVRTRD